MNKTAWVNIFFLMLMTVPMHGMGFLDGMHNIPGISFVHNVRNRPFVQRIAVAANYCRTNGLPWLAGAATTFALYNYKNPVVHAVGTAGAVSFLMYEIVRLKKQVYDLTDQQIADNAATLAWQNMQQGKVEIMVAGQSAQVIKQDEANKLILQIESKIDECKKSLEQRSTLDGEAFLRVIEDIKTLNDQLENLQKSSARYGITLGEIEINVNALGVEVKKLQPILNDIQSDLAQAIDDFKKEQEKRDVAMREFIEQRIAFSDKLFHNSLDQIKACLSKKGRDMSERANPFGKVIGSMNFLPARIAIANEPGRAVMPTASSEPYKISSTWLTAPQPSN